MYHITKFKNRIIVVLELEDINEILVWLKEEKENNINQSTGFIK